METTMDAKKESKAKKQKPKDNERSYKDVILLHKLTNKFKNRGLSISTIKSLIQFKSCLRAHEQELKEIQLALMDKYGVEPDKEGRYVYENHPKYEQILKELMELEDTMVTIKPTKFMTMKELMASTQDESLDVLELFADLILKEEK